MNLQNLISTIQSYEAIGYSLLFINAILSALFAEIALTKNRFKGIRDKMIGHLIMCALFFMILFACVLGLLALIFQFVPQEESLLTLLRRIWKFYSTSFFISFAAAIISSYLLFYMNKGSKPAINLGIALLVLSAIISGVQFFLSSFRLVNRPYMPMPVEAISSLINSRMNSYPFVISSTVLESLGDGSYLLIPENTDLSGETGESGLEDETTQPEVITEPTDLSGYISALYTDSYAPGMGAEDYLRKAYDLFLAGRYDDIDYVALMWHCMYDYSIYLPEYSGPGYLYEALYYYQQAMDNYGEAVFRYYNMAVAYYTLGDFPQVRDCLKRALELDEDVDEKHLTYSYYKKCILEWVDTESCNYLMEDALTVLDYDPQNLSMIVLYGACALDQNEDVDNAYRLLCKADDYFQGGSAMIKILRVICADLTGKDESFLLKDIFELEEKKGLSNSEEIYLVRYLFATNRSEELWGYIANIGNENGETLNAERALMKAEWFFKISHLESFVPEEAQVFLAQVQERLTQLENGTEEKELLILAKTLLQSSLGEIEPVSEIDRYEPMGISYTEYALAAVTAFNAGRYEEAISYCESFFRSAKEADSDSVDTKTPQLQPQEYMNLYYYIQLISAYSNFEYAKEFRKNSDQWMAYMERAELECAAFEQSSKSLYYIGELFQNLKNSIAIENGDMPDEETANIEVP
ncbi:MAG: hypothetical protein J1E98_00160 [Lachnospiraceae bacterium]|nr:hypothetical protein [Lachnospiraceae bacterium]